MAGKERGTYFLPEVDDQLLVVFEHGDINRPIVIGALWSKKQEPVEVNQSGKNNTKLIKSRSGHRIIFDDKDGAEKVTIVDSTKKNKIVLDAVNKVVKIESDGDIEVKASKNVIMHSNALKVGTSSTFSGEGQQMLTHAASTFGVKASSGITVSGASVTINQGGGAATSVSGSGAGSLGGASTLGGGGLVAGHRDLRLRNPTRSEQVKARTKEAAPRGATTFTGLERPWPVPGGVGAGRAMACGVRVLPHAHGSSPEGAEAL